MRRYLGPDDIDRLLHAPVIIDCDLRPNGAAARVICAHKLFSWLMYNVRQNERDDLPHRPILGEDDTFAIHTIALPSA